MTLTTHLHLVPTLIISDAIPLPTPHPPYAFMVWTGTPLALPVRFISIWNIFEINSAEIKYVCTVDVAFCTSCSVPTIWHLHTSYCHHHKNTVTTEPTTHLYWLLFTSTTSMRLRGVMFVCKNNVALFIAIYISHSSLNTTGLRNEMVSLNKLLIHLLSLYWKLLCTKVSTSEFSLQFLPFPALPTILEI